MNKIQLRWECRRGMLELDLMLLPFFENQFEQLTQPEQIAFQQLLLEADQDIYAWLLNFQQCDATHLQPIVFKIRHYHAIH